MRAAGIMVLGSVGDVCENATVSYVLREGHGLRSCQDRRV